MHTVKLRVNDGVYDKLIRLLSKFNKDEVEIILESADFAKNYKKFTAEKQSL
jgi:hypothetical protein